MIEGLRRAQEGMLPRVSQQEILANNLANSITPGFKRDRVTFEAQLQAASQNGSPGELPGGPSYRTQTHTTPDLRPGSIEETRNPLDLALDGTAFFSVQTPHGERYTRAGNFTINPQGELALPDGSKVLGDSGPIRVDGPMAVAADGTVQVNGETRGRLKLVNFPDPKTLSREGNTLWASSSAPAPAPAATVKQGFLEGSNVNPVEEMIDMMSAFRVYESNLKSAQAQSDSLGLLFGVVKR